MFKFGIEEDLEYRNTDAIRANLNKEIEVFFANGGEIEHIEYGIVKDINCANWKCSNDLDKARKNANKQHRRNLKCVQKP